MSTARRLNRISIDDYLAGELESQVKHEYLGGIVYAMAGGRNVHNLISTNLTTALGVRLRGQSCRPYNSDTKIRIQLPSQTRFYYPDASVICRPNPPSDTFQDQPVLVAEVLSNGTRRVDTTEKKESYQTIPTLAVYLLIEQDFAAATVHRRTEQGFAQEVYRGIDAVIPLSEIGTELPLTEIYEGVTFSPEPDDAAN